MIDTCAWKEFHLYDIFDIDMGNKMDRGKMYDGTIAFVGRTANNNGINARVGKVVNHEKYGTIEPYKKGCITLALGGSIGSCFIQEEPFYTSQNVAVLIPKTDQSDYALRFITSVITHSVLYGKYEAFTEELNKHIKTDFVISLPTTSDGQPDWNYMESYMRAVMEESEKSLENLKKADDTKHLIDVSGWGKFSITELFDMSLPKGDLQVKKVDDGDIPLITPSNFNNGMIQRISEHSNSTLYNKGSLTVDMFGNSYYQEEDFFVTAHGHVNVLLPKMPLNVYTGTFLASTIRAMFFDKYGFSEMCTQKVLKAESIRLPITATGEPDWQYMEDYMRRIMDKSKQIIADLQIGA